jgi:hypothetical protein
MARVTIYRREIARMTREIQREFDRHPIRVPVRADGPEFPPGARRTTIYNGPVIHGNADGAQLAWGNQAVSQTSHRSEQIAPGFEAIAQAVVRTLEQLPVAGLSIEDQRDADGAARQVLAEVVQPDPDRRKIRRALSAMKGLLAPLATGLVEGAGDGAHEWAKTAIERLGAPF